MKHLASSYSLIIVGPYLASRNTDSSVNSFGGTEKACSLLIRWLQDNSSISLLKVNTISLRYSKVSSFRAALREVQIITSFVVQLLRQPSPVIYFHSSARSSLRLLAIEVLCSMFRQPIILLTRSGKEDSEYFSSSAFHKLLIRLSFYMASTLVFQSEARRIAVESIIWPRPRQKLSIIPNWVDPLDLCPDSIVSLKYSLGTRTAYIASNLLPHKNVAQSIRLFLSIRDLFGLDSCHIFGDGPLAHSYRDLYRDETESGLVVFRGHVCRNVIREFARNSILYISLSSAEGLSNSLLEAMAAGCIPVLSSSVLVPRVTKPGVNCYVYDANLSDEFDSSIATDDRSLLAMALDSKHSVEHICGARATITDLLREVSF